MADDSAGRACRPAPEPVTLTGPGTFFMQTRSEGAFVSRLVPYLPKSSN